MIALTPLQFQLFTVTLQQITESVARLSLIREFNDDQCKVLIDKALEKTEELDKRREEH